MTEKDTGRRKHDADANGAATVSRRTAFLLLAMVVVLWGINWPIMKIGVAAIPPLWFGVLRLAIGAAVLFLVLIGTGRLAIPTRRDLPIIASVGLLQMAGFLALVNVAGENRKVNIGMLPEETFDAGDWVIIHMGFVVEKTDKAGADAAMAGLEMMGRGGETGDVPSRIDRAFP